MLRISGAVDSRIVRLLSSTLLVTLLLGALPAGAQEPEVTETPTPVVAEEPTSDPSPESTPTPTEESPPPPR